MNHEMLIGQETATDGKLRVFSLYVDFAAATRARWATSQISRLAGDGWKSTSEMWNLDSLAVSNPIRKMITQDAADADVLIIAISSLDRREVELVQWMESLAAGKANRAESGLFIGLLGDENSQAAELDWTVEQFLRCARPMDRDFIWHWMEAGVMDSNDWLTSSVAALLARKQPGRDVSFLWETAVAVA